jgi:ribose 5-phosphate isomerase B
MKRTFALASDHAGFRIKAAVKELLLEQGFEVLDFGAESEFSVDYPDYGKLAVRSVLRGEAGEAVLVCGSGVGMSIVANRFPGIRAALVTDVHTAEMCRLHNNANVLVLPGWNLQRPELEEILKVWISTGFEGGRHQRRLQKIEELEQEIRRLGSPCGPGRGKKDGGA